MIQIGPHHAANVEDAERRLAQKLAGAGSGIGLSAAEYLRLAAGAILEELEHDRKERLFDALIALQRAERILEARDG